MPTQACHISQFAPTYHTCSTLGQIVWFIPIKSKRPALVRCSNGKRGGFCCCKHTNNHWEYRLFSKGNDTKVDFFDIFVFDNVKSSLKIILYQPNKMGFKVKVLPTLLSTFAFLQRCLLYHANAWYYFTISFLTLPLLYFTRLMPLTGAVNLWPFTA